MFRERERERERERAREGERERARQGDRSLRTCQYHLDVCLRYLILLLCSDFTIMMSEVIEVPKVGSSRAHMGFMYAYSGLHANERMRRH